MKGHLEWWGPVTAAEAARRFADLLDSVEYDGEHFTIIRLGRAVAQIQPVSGGRGSAAKSLMRQHRPDAAWAGDVEATRSLLAVDERECVCSFSTPSRTCPA